MNSAPAKPPVTSFRRNMIVLAVVLVLGLAYLLRGVLVPLFLAFLLAYALDPFVDRLEGARVPRPLGAVLVMLGILTLCTTVLVYTIPIFVDEVADASATLPDKLRELRARAAPWFADTLHIKLPDSYDDLSRVFGDRFQGDRALDTAQTALFGTLGYVGVALSALIVPVFTLYLLIDFDRIVDRVEELIPRRWAPGISSVARDIHKTLSGYVRGQLTVNLVLAALYATGLRVVDIRLAVAIGVMTGMLAFVPYVGFTIGLSVAVGMAVLDWQGIGPVLGVIAVMGSVQILDGTIITPRILGRSVGLAPLEVILTMMAAGSLFGFLGVLLAVPLGAVAKILVQRAVRRYLGSRFYSRPPRAVVEIKPVSATLTPAVATALTAPRAASASAPTPHSAGAVIIAKTKS